MKKIIPNKEVLIKGEWESEKIKITNEGRYNPEKKITQYIQEKWREYKKKYPNDFDGQMAGVKQIKVSNEGVTLITQTVYFSEYIATRDNEFFSIFPNEKNADPLGMTIIPITLDKKILVTKRAKNATQNPGKYYFIGGYISPNEKKEINIQANIEREINEELGGNSEEICKSMVKGVAYDPIFAHPEIFISTKMNLMSEEIKDRWKKAVDKKESDEIFFVNETELKEIIEKKNVSWSFKIGYELFINEKENIF